MDETDKELLARYDHVKSLISTTKRQLERMKPSRDKDHKSRFCGSLEFARLTILSKLEERGLTPA